MTEKPPIIVWFRQDLRLADNPALSEAVATGHPVIPLYVLDDAAAGKWRMGGASRWWLHSSLESLARDLRSLYGGNGHARGLVLRKGDAAEILPKFAAELGARGVYWNRCYEPFAIRRDAGIKEKLLASGLEAKSFNASLLFEPWTVQTKSGTPFRVFTAFWRACAQMPHELPLPAPRRLSGLTDKWPASEILAEWELRPRKPDWAAGLRATWQPGEPGAQRRLLAFLDTALADYATERDFPGHEGTSRLSPHLHFGEIGPRQIFHAIHMHRDAGRGARGSDIFLKEIGWREFSCHLLFHFPDIPDLPLRREFAAFPWRDDPKSLRAWQRGMTGYPIVDAGMRELWTTGWMHNRVRMVVASFLVKDLLLPWQAGEEWFWDTLVDADLANNAASWQWVAGCGADAAPYFRIFNPVLQGLRFDPKGDYIRRWVPEIAELPDEAIHAPWTAQASLLSDRGISRYPAALIDHDKARRAALAAYQSLSAGKRD